MIQINKTIDAELTKIRRLRQWAWVSLLAYPIIMKIFGVITNSDDVLLFVGVLWAFVPMCIWGRVYNCKCPNCGKYFHGLRWFWNPLARKCLHCGIKLKIQNAAMK